MVKQILLNPGPCNINPKLRDMLSNIPDMCHRSEIYYDIVEEVKVKLYKLANVSRDEYEIAILNGSGTLGVEAMIHSFGITWETNSTATNFIITNGNYGNRISKICCSYNMPKIVYNVSNYTITDYDVNNIKISYGNIDNFVGNVFIVHHETTTGVLNNLDNICNIFPKNANIFIDATSSFGAHYINFERNNIAAISFSSNKCIESIPGCCFVIYRKNLKINNCMGGIYSNLKDYNNIPFTPNTFALATANFALTLLQDETINNRFNRYFLINRLIRKNFCDIGFDTIINEKNNSCVLTTFVAKSKEFVDNYVKFMYNNDIIIYPSALTQHKEYFRISNIGNITMEQINELLDLTRGYNLIKKWDKNVK